MWIGDIHVVTLLMIKKHGNMLYRHRPRPRWWWWWWCALLEAGGGMMIGKGQQLLPPLGVSLFLVSYTTHTSDKVDMCARITTSSVHHGLPISLNRLRSDLCSAHMLDLLCTQSMAVAHYYLETFAYAADYSGIGTQY